MYDICIIGSGPAGLTICAELADSGKKIAVIESGGRGRDPHADSLRKVKSTGEIAIRPSSRERIFGGTSTTWSGLSAPMDRVDLEAWPIEYDELVSYYAKLGKYGFPEFSDFNNSTLRELRKNADFSLESDMLEEKIFIAKDPPWNFGKQLRYLFDNPNITFFMDSTVTNLESEKRAGSEIPHIKSVEIQDKDGKKSAISAKIFVIAAGGIESPRLLLLSKLGNEHDQVGRYITNHPKNSHGIIRLTKPAKDLTHLLGYLDSGYAKSAGIRVRENVQKSLGILNCYVRLEPIFPWTDKRGVSDFIQLTKKFKLFLDWWKKQQRRIIGLKDWNETGDDVPQKRAFVWSSGIVNIIKDFPAVSAYAFHRLFHGKKVVVKTIRLRNFMDMEARAENRITLSSELDTNGKQIPIVTLNTSPRDQRSVIELHRIIDEEIQRKKIGVLESDLVQAKPWPINSEASHHLGGTIMGNDPKTSVVDRNLKVHSVSNLYVCSSSVFPTSGNANPTYTICALAIRLAELLRKI